jgi:hypothetical protein
VEAGSGQVRGTVKMRAGFVKPGDTLRGVPVVAVRHHRDKVEIVAYPDLAQEAIFYLFPLNAFVSVGVADRGRASR